MCAYSFDFLDKTAYVTVLPQLFDILYTNMSIIAPTGNSYNDDKNTWLSGIIPQIAQSEREIVLMYVNGDLAGYFQYSVRADVFMMEEIQLKPAYQGSGIFKRLYQWVLQLIPNDVSYVEAYANKRNSKSQDILTHIGLSVIGENKTGMSLHFKGDYKSFKTHFE